ncbi:ABC transporter permease [Stieleria sp. TO1_6]|uniref:ABC transporter permease n=1 Tax=Stieleria tagensis TaxID=2956795 RepID=UPI00209B79AD|nr:ABC transporter permease [Stieleria tagensis]MCO8124450.1 ABC transporter permease [Stieleria tagensis]
MNAKRLQRLIWKDGRTLAPLALATPIAVLAFFLLLSMMASFVGLNGPSRVSMSYAILFLLPMLVAYGAPAVLIGGEEESGSLAWLRTLPAGWRSIALSKFLVACGSVLLVWLCALFSFLAYWSSLPERLVQGIVQSGGLPDPFWLPLAAAVVGSIALLTLSFITAYWIRSPITALLSVVPLLGVVMFGYFYVFNWIAPFTPRSSARDPIDNSVIAILSIWTLACFGLLLAIMSWAAKHRLTKPESSFAERLASSSSEGAFRPPSGFPATWYGSSMARVRPKPVTALLWQQLRSMRWHLGLLTAIAVIGVLFMITNSSYLVPWGICLCTVSLLLIAAFTFYGDSVHQRVVFLSDRGVSPTLVWATRLAPTLIVVLGVLALVAAVTLIGLGPPWDSVHFRDWLKLSVAGLSIALATYALSQLVSQWSPRPTLSFFAAPVFVCFAAMALGGLFSFYVNSLPILLLSAAVLFYASWRLMPQWMAGNTGRGYVGPFIGYIALAVVLPYVLVLGTRWVTMPAERTAWRQEMLATPLSIGDQQVPNMPIQGSAYGGLLGALANKPWVDEEGVQQRIDAELADDDAIGEHISFRELLQIVSPVATSVLTRHHWSTKNNLSLYLNPPVYSLGKQDRADREMQFSALEVLLKWSRQSRRQAVNGNLNFRTLFGVAETADWLTSKTLKAYVDREGVTPDVRELLQQLPDSELVRRSRQQSLIHDWRNYQAIGGSVFGVYPEMPFQSWLFVERERGKRYLDDLVHFTLDHWKNGQTIESNDEMEKVGEYINGAYMELSSYDPAPYNAYVSVPDQLLRIAETDRQMKTLRQVAK